MTVPSSRPRHRLTPKVSIPKWCRTGIQYGHCFDAISSMCAFSYAAMGATLFLRQPREQGLGPQVGERVEDEVGARFLQAEVPGHLVRDRDAEHTGRLRGEHPVR